MLDAQWLTLFEAQPVLLAIVVAVFGLVVGSFLNVVILRLPRMMQAAWQRECTELLAPDDTSPTGDEAHLSLARPPSTCPHCGQRIRAHQNIPLVSYLLLRGRCAVCRTRISPRYPLVEALTALLSVFVALHFGPHGPTVAALALTWALIALAFIDYDTQLLPDSIVLPLLWFGLLLSLSGMFTDARSAIIGAAVGYLSLWFVFHAFRLLTGKEGMGYGDFKLLGAFGAWFGWQALAQIVLFSALAGALFGGALIMLRWHERDRPLPFGPFLAAAGWIYLLWGPALNTAYLRFSGLG